MRKSKFSKLTTKRAIESLDLMIDHIIMKANIMIANYDNQFGFIADVIGVKQFFNSVFIIIPLKL